MLHPVPHPVPVKPCPRCQELALVAGECRSCGHLEAEVLEACDGELPVGAVVTLGGASVSRPWIAGDGLLGALASGPLAACALGALVVLGPHLPVAANLALGAALAVLAWGFAAMLANATTIAIQGGRLAVRHGPIPMPGLRPLSVPAGQIERLAIRRDEAPGELSDTYALVVHWPGAARTVYASDDREEVARMLRVLRDALPRTRRAG